MGVTGELCVVDSSLTNKQHIYCAHDFSFSVFVKSKAMSAKLLRKLKFPPKNIPILMDHSPAVKDEVFVSELFEIDRAPKPRLKQLLIQLQRCNTRFFHHKGFAIFSHQLGPRDKMP